LEQIDRAMLRPGRFDAVEFCGLPDLSAFRQLVQVLISDDDRGDIDYEEAYPFFEGFSYAFISNAVQTIIRSAIISAKGDLEELKVGTQNLIDAANSVRGHFELMQQPVVVEAPALDSVMRGMVSEIVSDEVESSLNDRCFSDDVDYDTIHSIVDDVLEGRLNGASLQDNDGDKRYEISTN
jgi:SpoVK/Ycf46/Vps4 family AAA+-type ATPase